MGEPHTQEHLLLGQGKQGRDVASHETASLTSSTAFTMQVEDRVLRFIPLRVRTSSSMSSNADLDALLHPDYTDEE
jgi:hypothetical protein